MSTKQHDETEVCDAGFTAADMATAAAQGFRDGQAAELAAMREGGEPVGYIITNTLVAGDRAIVFPDKADRAPKIFPRTPVYTHHQPAAQDAEPCPDCTPWPKGTQPALHPTTGEPMGTDAQEATAWKLTAENLQRENVGLWKALKDAATSLETISRLAGRTHYVCEDGDQVETYMKHHDQVRRYANSRASVAREALAGTAPAPMPDPTPQADSQPAPVLDMAVMQLAESVGLIGPASRVHDLHAAIQRFHDLICVNATIKAAVMAADAISGAATSARDYPPLPMQFACSGVFPVYSADQMRAYVDADRAARAPADSVTAPAGEVETKRYADGTTATGIGPLPKHSPSVQHALRVLTDVESMLGGANGPTIQIRAVLGSLAAAEKPMGRVLLDSTEKPVIRPQLFDEKFLADPKAFDAMYPHRAPHRVAYLYATPPAQAADSVLEDAARDVLAERARQISAEGWTSEHDDEHQLDGDLAQAAACYAHQAFGNYGLPTYWPWAAKWWKPSKDPRRNLIKAGALILAEIERIDRAARKQGGA